MPELPDDRVTCSMCDRAGNVVIRGNKVLACGAWLGEPDMNGVRRHPLVIRDLPLRCFFFRAKPGAPDQRRGVERWPCTEPEFRAAHKQRLTVWWLWMLPSVDKRRGRA